MAYDKKTWTNGVDKANETNMNHIEEGIYNNSVALADLSNVIYDVGTVTGTTSALETLEVCSVTVNKGIYLVLGSCVSSINDASQTVQVRFSGTNVTDISGNDVYRGTMMASGGLAGWKVYRATQDNAVITLSSKVSSSFSITGNLCVIRLGD